jgi:very-short-patch-repair endonuclease/muconolactone delta-isomerase
MEDSQGPRGSTDSFLGALCTAYTDLLRRQRSAASAFVRWSRSRRAHEFCWFEKRPEVLITTGKTVSVAPSDAEYDSVAKMKSTLELNPYERQVHYGYPYVVGSVGGKPVRAPLLSLSVRVEEGGGGALSLVPSDEGVRFNSLPFRIEGESAAQELALARLIEATPSYPTSAEELGVFCEMAVRELRSIDLICEASLDGRLASPPKEPRPAEQLRIVDCAALFIAPQTSYFLVSDLEGIGASEQEPDETAFGRLLLEQADRQSSDALTDSRNVVFPFPSNRSQRQVARFVDDETNRLVVVQGPPGTGKSLTIANLVCHLVASGKTVLVSSQKDKALQVVDEILRTLSLNELPMTLLRNDIESKQELRARLDGIEKTKAASETEEEEQFRREAQSRTLQQHDDDTRALVAAVEAEHQVVRADVAARNASTLSRRIATRVHARFVRAKAARSSPRMSDELALATKKDRQLLMSGARETMAAAADHRVSGASKLQRNQLREFSRLLARRQTSYRNFSVFDRLKQEPERCHNLLTVLPCWIMAPDDVARLFPCEPGLFDVAIVDEASQCDLPSMLPVLYRAKQAVVAGDSRQMQARRFQFTSEQVAKQAWCEQGLDRWDPDRWLDPTKSDLLQLAAVRADEHAFLDEHYRCLPPIIGFSNARWYAKRLRIMRDLRDRRLGDSSEPIISLHSVKEGSVEPDTQENLNEAKAVIRHLARKLRDPVYAGASFGVICLFEEQMRLMADLVAEGIPEQQRADHHLIVVNPDGFQGDERDVIYYSMSYDDKNMTKSQIAARQADYEHIQGMLNVAFTRARDEIHVFVSATPSAFGMASGAGAIRDWLEYCASQPPVSPEETGIRSSDADSEFEAEVQERLRSHGLKVVPQYPACGYRIDIVAERDGRRVAIECDGEYYHLDEHGRLRLEDVYRQELLERAGWEVLRIPYRAWRKDAEAQVARVLRALHAPQHKHDPDQQAPHLPTQADSQTNQKSTAPTLGPFDCAVIKAIQAGNHDRPAAFRHAREALGYQRLGRTIEHRLDAAVRHLAAMRIIIDEEGDLFLAEGYRDIVVAVNYQRPVYSTPYNPNWQRRRRRRY